MSMHMKWNYWINEPIFLDKGVTNILKRKSAISYFCRHGLLPLVQNAGYKLHMNEVDLVKTVLSLLYRLYEGKTVTPIQTNILNEKEQYDLYSYKLDTQVWMDFWETWGDFQEFQEDAYAYNLRFILSEFVWTWLDLDSSKAAIELDNELYIIYMEEEGAKGRDDLYLQETSKRDYQDRHWH
jgi:hypothetical protein